MAQPDDRSAAVPSADGQVLPVGGGYRLLQPLGRGAFGLAKLLEQTQLQTASHAGTPVCMAPEVWDSKLSVHSDQYSLAATYVQLRTGRFPFTGDSLMALMKAHLTDAPDLGLLGPHE